MTDDEANPWLPRIVPLGESALLVRFADRLSERANARAVAFARWLDAAPPAGVTELDPNLVSVLVRFDPSLVGREQLAGELRVILSQPFDRPFESIQHDIPVRYGGDDGPDLAEAADVLQVTPDVFIARHSARPLKVLTTGFAPGFVYCGFHEEAVSLPRRHVVRDRVPAGSVLFAARQTAICATPIRSGWHLIGRTGFRNFDPGDLPPTRLKEGDRVRFVPA